MKNLIPLLVIIFIGIILRFYQLGQIPISLNWDEASNGYDAWAIANYGIDQWGNSFPLIFKSFEDDKHPVHTYITAIFIKIFGLSEWSTRLPAAFFGVLNIILLYLLAMVLTRQRLIALSAAFMLAVSPYNIQFSRFNHELNFAIFFFLLGSWLFFKGLKDQPKLIALAFLCWGIDLLTYHSAKIIVMPLVLLLVAFYAKDLWKHKASAIIGGVILLFFILIVVLNPRLLGTARINQTSFSEGEMSELSSWYQQTQNPLLGRAQITIDQYLMHLSPTYLFISGDSNPRHSTQVIGEFYWLELPFLLFGLFLLIKKPHRWGLFLLAWALISPLPASLVKDAPHASRAMYMTGSWHLIAAIGMGTFLLQLRKANLQLLAIVALVAVYGYQLWGYYSYYLYEYDKRYAIEWQYGMKQIAQYIKSHKDYGQVFITDERHQPYIFLAYYLQTPPGKLVKTVDYTTDLSRSYNLVAFYDKYYFGGWDPIESMPNMGVLYVLTPSEYSGLRHKQEFMVKEKIVYPNGSDAFYIVSKN